MENLGLVRMLHRGSVGRINHRKKESRPQAAFGQSREIFTAA